ncbi:MAG: mannose-1-phosphate guanylyltransferase [Alloprevotella sp.]|nr:mannose-1-phosphate guanylyltransferase [Bacteroidales bacterium]MDY3943783.1 mannose-1-phosphate guanylyltransferase [Alloprevotella sp.]
MTNNNHLVIMAGGVGSRFWPMSSAEKPKQFLDVMGCGKTLIQMTLERFSGIVPMENVWVVTSTEYKELVAEQLPDIPQANILLEPCRRNTAPCVCYVSWKIKKRNPKANIVVTPADHLVTRVDDFQQSINEALEFTAETDSIVTLGIKPSRPDTGYGYIEADLSYSSSRKKNIFRVDSFKEKPSLNVAEEYVRQGNFLWNAGIFIWSVSTVVNAFRVYAPEISRAFESLLPIYDTAEEQAAIDRLYNECQSISVDYAIMEKADDIFVYPVDFGWSDLGTWNSLRLQAEKDRYGNACIGPNIRTFETYNSIIHTTGEREVVVQGLDGYIVAERDGVLMVCKLSEEQRIKLFHD